MIAIATVDNISLACVRAEPWSQWKGFSPGMTGMRAIYAARVVSRLEAQVVCSKAPTGWSVCSDTDFGGLGWIPRSIVFRTVLKKYRSLIHGQPVLEAVLDLKRGNGLVVADIKRVRCDVFHAAFDFAGGGRYGSEAGSSPG